MMEPYGNQRSRHARGLEIETLAAAHVCARGLTLVARNFRVRCGELDLICSDERVLVIIEVRQRTHAAFGGAVASVTWRKQRRIARAAAVFLQRQPRWQHHRVRFDVIGVDGAPDGAHRITWLRDAFRQR